MNHADQKSVHLTEEQFTEILLGIDENPAAQAHLATCELCEAELTRTEDAIGIFRQTSAEWSRQRVSAIPAPRPGFFARIGLASRPAFAGMAVAAAVAVAVAVPFAYHGSSVPRQAAVVHQSPVPTPVQIKEDNDLLEAINDEISEPRVVAQQTFEDTTSSTLKH